MRGGQAMCTDRRAHPPGLVLRGREAAELWASRGTKLPEKPLGRLEPTSTFSYRHRQQPTTLSDVADVTARSGSRAPVFATAMSDTLPFKRSFLAGTNGSKPRKHRGACPGGSKVDS